MPSEPERTRAPSDVIGKSLKTGTYEVLLDSVTKPKTASVTKTSSSGPVTKSKPEAVAQAGDSAVDQSQKALKAAISQRYDKLNALWKKAEDDLREYLVPVEVIHEYKRSSHPDENLSRQYGFEVAYCLAWTKTKTGWHLCHGYLDESWNGGDDVEYSFTPILDSSIDRRNECVPVFKDLKNKVIEQAKQLVPKLDDNIASLAEALK